MPTCTCIFLVQLLGVSLSHPDELEQVDKSLFHNIMQCEDISGTQLNLYLCTCIHMYM